MFYYLQSDPFRYMHIEDEVILKIISSNITVHQKVLTLRVVCK